MNGWLCLLFGTPLGLMIGISYFKESPSVDRFLVGCIVLPIFSVTLSTWMIWWSKAMPNIADNDSSPTEGNKRKKG